MKDYDDLPTNLVLPVMSLRKMVSQTKGMNTHAFASDLPQFVQNARKVLHLEVGKSHVPLIQRLVSIAKSTGIFEAWWGSIVHPTEVLEADAPKKDRDALASMAHDHTSFTCAVRTERLIGISRLDKKVKVFRMEEDGTKVFRGVSLSLREILLGNFETKDGRSVIGGIFQRASEDPYIVIPNEAEMESLIMRMNHQLPAFLLHYLPTKGIPLHFVQDLLKASCDPDLYNKAQFCTWDADEWVITRPDEAELKAKKEKEEKDSLWWKGMVNIHLVTNQNKPPSEIAPEARYDLDGERSVNTIHQKGLKSKPSAKARLPARAKSDGDGDFPGDDSKSDSASANAHNKPYSTVGFRPKQDSGDDLSSTSESEEDAHVDVDDGQSPGSQGKGG